MTLRVAILGSGNIGTDLMYKVLRNPAFDLAGVAGADPSSEGLARARALGIATSDRGAGPFLDEHPDVAVAFDATSAHAHVQHAPLLAARGVRCIDLTPAALGPVRYAEIVSTVASRSAGPGTRSNIDEFTIATARSLETLGGAGEGKAIIILNPAEPPIMMRNAVYAEIDGMAAGTATAAVRDAVDRVAAYVPGYRLATEPLVSDGLLTAFIEVEGAGDYLPRFAGNLDIMTSAAVRVAERYAERRTA